MNISQVRSPETCLSPSFQEEYKRRRSWFAREVARLKNLSTILPALQKTISELKSNSPFLEMAYFTIYRQFVVDAYRIALDPQSKKKSLVGFWKAVKENLTVHGESQFTEEYIAEVTTSLDQTLEKVKKLRHNLFAHTQEGAFGTEHVARLDMEEIGNCYEAIESAFCQITLEVSFLFSGVNAFMDLVKIENLLNKDAL